MSARDLVGLILLGSAAYALSRRSATTLPAPLLTAPARLPGAAGGATSTAPASYTATTKARESGGDPNAKNPRSSASGLFQFTKSTWEKLGGKWGSDPRKPFGGLAVTPAEQQARFDQLTRANAAGLARAGIGATSAALYAAHFLGIGTAVRVLKAPASESLAGLVGSRVMAANPHLKGFTVADFRRWLEARS